MYRREPLSKLSVAKITKLTKRGAYADGGNLYLQVSAYDTKAWVFRYMVAGRARNMGLGPLALVSLKEARERAAECRRLLWQGVDPIEAKQAKRTAARIEAAKTVTFGWCVDQYIKQHEVKWTNVKHRDQWHDTLHDHAALLCKLPVASVDTALVLKVLEPIWTETPETASRLRGRIERVLAWATVSGYRQGDNPARWVGHLREVLPSKNQLKAIEHHRALPYAEVPAFMAALRKQDGVTARALEFAVLNANRTGEVRYAVWDEIDFAAKVWTVPAARMKGRIEHRIPLSDRALEILRGLPREDGSPYVFPGSAAREPVGSKAMSRLLDRLTANGYTVHGFRSSFRDWCEERTNFRHLAERCLAHTEKDKVKAAYQRGDLLDKRRVVMAAWAKYCESTPVTTTGSVTAIRKASA
jgi:integrase